MRNRVSKDLQDTSNLGKVIKTGNHSYSSKNIAYRGQGTSGRSIKKNNYKLGENSHSFHQFSKNFYSKDATNRSRNENSASKVFADISNRRLLCQLDQLRKPVTKKAIQIVKNEAEKIIESQKPLNYQYAPYNYTQRVRNCQSEGKLIKKYDYLGNDRVCIRENDYVSPPENSQYKWKRSKSTRGYLSKNMYNQGNLRVNPEEALKKKTYEALDTKKYSYKQPTPYLAIKDNIDVSSKSKWFSNNNTNENKGHSIREVITSEFNSSSDYNPPNLSSKLRDYMKSQDRKNDLLEKKSTFNRANLIAVHDHEDLDSSRIDKINEKLDKYIKSNMK